MDEYPHPSTLIQGWTNTPIPNFSLSASGLILLADLSTVAQRTALRGGSSWLDSLLLVPGLHYQQAADELSHGGDSSAVLHAVEAGPDGRPVSHRIVNQAVVGYILRTAREGRTVVLDVGEIPVRPARGWRAGGGGRAGDVKPDLGWAAHLLYLASPVLTCIASVFVVLLGDLWALGLLVALMVSRILNIFVIKQRSRRKPEVFPPPFSQPIEPKANRVTQYTVDINPDTTVILRGLSTDLQALTTTVWLRPKTHVEGYLEATAKVLVYLVAACSGNATQAGNLVMLVLVLVSAGLLALSNAQVKELRNGGRVVAPFPPDDKLTGGKGGRCGRCSHASGGVPTNRRSAPRREVTEAWPLSSNLSSLNATEDSVEKGETRNVFGRSYIDEDPLNYRVQLDTRLGTLEVVARRDRDQRNHGTY